MMDGIVRDHMAPFVERWAAVHSKDPRRCRAVVAMSGGVDSALCALLLQRSGLFGSVEALYMHNWDVEDEWGANTQQQQQRMYHRQKGQDGSGIMGGTLRDRTAPLEGGGSACPTSAQDWQDVQAVCDALGVPCRRQEFVREYWVRVFEPMLHMYERGDMTPNPDVWCNRHVKFDRMMEYAREEMGADLVVTGHYARLQWTSAARSPQDTADSGQRHRVQLLRGVDRAKDQSYFLSTVRQRSLQHAFFPLGALHKSTVVKPLVRLVPELEAVHSKRESMGVCFIGKRNMGDFLEEYIEPQTGHIMSHEGEVLGRHSGMHRYTIGQGARIGGQREKWFVYDKDAATNTVFVCPGSNHPALYSSECIVDECAWSYREEPSADADASGGGDGGGGDHTQDSESKRRRWWWQSVVHDLQGMSLTAQVRYHQDKGVPCTIQPVEGHDGRLRVLFSSPVRGITPGQVCVLYNGEHCLGGGIVMPKQRQGG